MKLTEETAKELIQSLDALTEEMGKFYYAHGNGLSLGDGVTDIIQELTQELKKSNDKC